MTPNHAVSKSVAIIAFASPSAVIGFAASATGTPAATLAAIGPTTAAAVHRRLGRPADLVAPTHDFDGLAKTILDHLEKR